MTKSKQAPTQGHGLDGLYAALRRPGITRVADGGWFAGVSTGLGRWLGVDALVVRAGFILLSIFFGMGVGVYLVLWLLMPDERGEIHLERALKHGEGHSIFLLVVTAISLFGGGPWWGGDLHGFRVGAFLLLGVGAWWFFTRTDQGRGLVGWPWNGTGPAGAAGAGASGAGDEGVAATATPYPGAHPAASTGNAAANAGAARTTTSVPTPPAPAPRSRRTRTRTMGFAPGLLLLGVSVVAGAVLAEVARSAAWMGNPLAVGLAAATGVLGLGIVVAGLAGRRAGALTTFTVIGMVAAIVVTAAPARLTEPWTVGDQNHVVTSVGGPRDFQLGLGQMRVDLTGLTAAELKGRTNPVPVTATAGVGQIDLVVPEGVAVEVRARARVGAFTATGANGGDVSINSGDGTGDGRGMSMSMNSNDGVGINRTVTFGPAQSPALVVDAEVGVGEIRVTTGGTP